MGAFCILLRGPESNRGLEVLLHLVFLKGMDYTMFLDDFVELSIIVSEPSEHVDAGLGC